MEQELVLKKHNRRLKIVCAIFSEQESILGSWGDTSVAEKEEKEVEFSCMKRTTGHKTSFSAERDG